MVAAAFGLESELDELEELLDELEDSLLLDDEVADESEEDLSEPFSPALIVEVPPLRESVR